MGLFKPDCRYYGKTGSDVILVFAGMLLLRTGPVLVDVSFVEYS